MSSTPLLGPVPISSPERGILDPKPDLCFACTPMYDHNREWVPKPDPLDRKRTLILCFDGTSDSFDQDNSNVVQFLAMLKKDDPAKQLVYYQAGIGTYTSNVLDASIFAHTSKLLDKMVAWNLPDHIKDGYKFLMQNYRAGDQICIFGFSRGAFTARALAGMLQKIGLLPPSNLEQLPFAYAMYAKDDYEGRLLSAQFKRTFSINVRIKFLGVWDTVQFVGLIPKYLPFSGSNNAIEYFRHALSLDEHRVGFIPFLCTTKDSGMIAEAEARINDMTWPDTDVKEVFFAGAHCDVGGGSVKNSEHHSLARIPLRWMIRECFKAKIGIIFDAHMLKHEAGMNINSLEKPPRPPADGDLRPLITLETKGFLRRTLGGVVSGIASPFVWAWGKLPHHDSRKLTIDPEHPNNPQYAGSEEAEEMMDIICPIYDQLDVYWPPWKIMEWMPWVAKRPEAQQEGGISTYKLTWNLGYGRRVDPSMIRDNKIKVHRSVRTRIMASKHDKERYLPRIVYVVSGKERPLTPEEWENGKCFDWVD